ncbi:MAG: 50S ribosomal protein L17 [Patescibacteria group bacterium]|nr:50S ribosomal protein L17 [Patescibacteria group bacterium]
MRHRVKKGRKFKRDVGERKAMLRSLLTSLVEHGHLETTLPKAKEVRRQFDLLVNKAKRAEVHGNFSLKRKIYSFLTLRKASEKLFGSLIPGFSDRRSGYLTLRKSGKYRSDGAELAELKFVELNGGKYGEKSKSADSPKVVASSGRLKRTVGKTVRKNS